MIMTAVSGGRAVPLDVPCCGCVRGLAACTITCVPGARLDSGGDTSREMRASGGTPTVIGVPTGLAMDMVLPETAVRRPEITTIPSRPPAMAPPIRFPPPRGPGLPGAPPAGPEAGAAADAATPLTLRAVSVPLGAFAATTRAKSPTARSLKVARWRLRVRVVGDVCRVTVSPVHVVRTSDPAETDAMVPNKGRPKKRWPWEPSRGPGGGPVGV